MSPKSKKKTESTISETKIITLYKEKVEKIIKKSEKRSDERKGIYDEKVLHELKSTFSLPKYGLKNRTMNVMARIDEKTSKILDALVALELAPSRSAAAAFLISEAIQKDKEKYLGILDCFLTFKQAKMKAQYTFFKQLKESEETESED